jgi:hypothetical protein
MTTVAQALDLVTNRLSKGSTQLINVLDGTVNSVVTSITLTYDFAGAGVGSILEIDDEQMYVVATSSLTRTVIRGWNGSTAAEHDDLAVIRVNPRFLRSETLATIEEELRSWPLELGRYDTVEVTLPAGAWKAELTPTNSGAEVWRLLDANIQPETAAEDAQRSRIDVRLLRDADADEYSSGYAIQTQGNFPVARVIQVDMVTSFDFSNITTSSTNLITGVGLRETLVDVLYYGVMWREMSTREIMRTDPAASAPLDAQEVPPTHLLQTAQALKEMRDQRLSEERTRMFDTWPLLMTTSGS